jgi:O-antigen/teichoic acid export membrane protein
VNQRGHILGKSATYLLSNVLNALIPFALLPVLTRFLAPSEYGQVAMFQTLLAALSAFVGMSATGAANRHYYDHARDPSELQTYNGACVQILLATTLIALVAIGIFGPRLQRWLGLSFAYQASAVIACAATVLVQLRLGQWQVRQLAKKYGIFQVAQSATNAALSLLLVVELHLGAAGRIGAQLAAAALFAALAVLLLYREGLLRLAVWRPAQLSDALQFGVPLFPHVAGGFLITSIDRIVINERLGLASAGTYMVAVQIAAGLTLIFDAINKAYVPWLFEHLHRNSPDEKVKLVRLTYVYFAAILAGALVAFVVGRQVIVIVAGTQYRAAGDVIGWLVLGQGFGGMYLMVTNYIFFSKRTGLLSIVTLASGLVNVALLFALVGTYGAQGAGIAFSCAMGLRFLLTWAVAHYRHPMPWFSFSTVFRRNEVRISPRA